MQVMIYVGGTLVLLIFGVMLTAQGPFITMKTRSGEWVLGLLVGGLLLAVLVSAVVGVQAWRLVAIEERQPEVRVTATRLGMGDWGDYVRHRRCVHGDQAERARRADGHRAGAQRSERELRGAGQ